VKAVVVTGVSTGIGWSIAEILVRNGYCVFGSVRKQEDANRLTMEFGQNFVPLFFDVTDEAAVQAAAQKVREELKGETLFGLVNNAGIAVAGPLLHLATDEFRKQLEVNLVSVLIVTKAFAPLLGADRSLRGKPGRIINISSVGGKRALPFMGAYAASKHGLEGFSESLRRELMLYGIDVIIVGPGTVATPIWDKAEQVNIEPYKNTDYYPFAMRFQRFAVKTGKSGFPPEKVAEVVFNALTSTKPRVRYSVTSASFRNILQQLLPKRIVDNMIAKNLGFKE
jgi:NAD(P)-dependent dehydrogenase (short-subunit alcohol dehydrogenase family)